jgi:hypothetical protein
MIIKVIMMVSYFIKFKEFKMLLQAKMSIFTIGIMYSDLIKIHQGLINNNY